jgi:hypothetical protein
MRAAGHRPDSDRPARPRRTRPRTRLARDQAAEAQARRDRLAHRITDDCPRCGWHGYFFHHITIVDGDWAAGVCDDCYADLHPHITVTVQFFAVCDRDRPEPLAVIRQRTRSDWGPLNNAEIMTWRLDWHHTPLLIEIASGGSVTEDLVPVSRHDAAQIAVRLAGRHWPPDAARLPWVAAAYPG